MNFVDGNRVAPDPSLFLSQEEVVVTPFRFLSQEVVVMVVTRFLSQGPSRFPSPIQEGVGGRCRRYHLCRTHSSRRVSVELKLVKSSRKLTAAQRAAEGGNN
jgi:hypothetical protein